MKNPTNSIGYGLECALVRLETERRSVTEQEIQDKGYANPEALVSTQWVADHLDDTDNIRIAGVRRGRAPLRHRPRPKRRKDRLGRGPQRPAHARLPGPRALREPHGREGHHPRHDGHLLRGQEQLVGDLRPLGLQALRPRQREGHGRGKGQVGGRGPRDDPGGAVLPEGRVPDPGAGRREDPGLQGRRR